MYEPTFNSVLVQIDDKDGEWGGGGDESMLGKSFRMGTVVEIGRYLRTEQYPLEVDDIFDLIPKDLKGRQVMWNEGTEAGTVFEFDGKQFGLIYWWDIRGVLVGEKAAKA